MMYQCVLGRNLSPMYFCKRREKANFQCDDKQKYYVYQNDSFVMYVPM